MKKSARHGTVRAAVGLGAVGFAAAAALAVASPAAAHVTVNPGDATAGERARVDIRVPTESDTESTVAVEVHFPEDPPISSASVGKVLGWTAEIAFRELDEPIQGDHGEEISEVVESITWTADNPDAEIGPGEFGEFPVGLGPLPEAEQLFFPTLQTYSDDEVVRWIEEPQGDAEPDFPAPSLTLAAAGADPDTTGTAGEGEAAEPADNSAADADSGSDSDAGMWLGLAGLVAGLAGLAVAGFALSRSRSSSSGTGAAS